MSFAPSSAGTESRDSVEPLPLFSLKDLLPDPPTLRERIWRRAELKWFDEAIKPFLYRLVRYELEIPGGLSATRNYWISPRLGFKTDLRTGILYSLETGNRVGYYFDLWMCGKGYTRWNFPAPKKSLQAWILKQQAENPEPESRLFTEEVAELEWIFFYVMFLRGPLEKGTGTARLLWEGFRLLFGPVRTRRLFDFSTHHQLLRFLRYAADHPNPLFSVRKISGPKKKEEVWEIRDRGFNVIKAEFAPYAEGYAAAHLAHGYGDDPALTAEIEAALDATAKNDPENEERGNFVSRYRVGHRAIMDNAPITTSEIMPKAVCSSEQTNEIPPPTRGRGELTLPVVSSGPEYVFSVNSEVENSCSCSSSSSFSRWPISRP